MNDFYGKNYLVTGGAGFIGSHLVDALLNLGAKKVSVVDNFFLGKDKNLFEAKKRHPDALEIYREDASDYQVMERICHLESPDIVYNLATKALLYSYFNPSGAYNVNTDIALCLGNLLAKKKYNKLVHLSSSEVYGSAQHIPMDENHPLLAETSYAAGKAGADLALISYVKMFDLDITILRPFNNYGPRQNHGSLAAVIPLTIKRILEGEQPVIHGTGDQTRDFINVKDTVSAVLELSCMSDTKGEIFNLGSGIQTSIKTIVTTIAKLLSYSGEIKYDSERKADVIAHCADVSKLTNFIDGLELTAFEDGIRETIEWYQREEFKK